MTYLKVPFAEKDEAKSLGARWDLATRAWYVPSGLDVTLFSRWLPRRDGALPATRQVANAAGPVDAQPRPSGAESHDSVILRGAIYLAKANTHCWKCSGWTEVVAVGAEDVEFEGERTNELMLFSSVQAFPREIAVLVAQRWPRYRVAYSKTMGGLYYMNHCEKCGVAQGDFFLHSEPGGAFYPGDAATARRIVAERILRSGSFSLRADVSISIPNLLDKYATRVDWVR